MKKSLKFFSLFLKTGKNFEFLFLSAVYGLILFRILLAFYPAGMDKNDDFEKYVLGWLIFPWLGLFFGGVLEQWRRRKWTGDDFFYPLFLFLNTTFLLLILDPESGRFSSGWVLFSGFLGVQWMGTILLNLLRPSSQNPNLKLNNIFFVLIFASLILWFSGDVYDFFYFLEKKIILYSTLIIGIVCFLYWSTVPDSRKDSVDVFSRFQNTGAGRGLIFYTLALLAIIAVVTDPRFSCDHYHYSFYLGPLADLLAGKSLLVNINSQYGVLVFYFLESFFKFLPLGFSSFSLVYTCLLVIQYFLFFFIVRQLFRSQALAFFCLAALLLINDLSPIGWAVWYPSTGPLRFGFIYLLMALVVLRNQNPKKENLFLWLEAGVASTAFWWSFEVCVYTVPAYLGLIFLESWRGPNRKPLFLFQFLRTRFLMFASLTSLLGGVLYWDIFRRSGELPHWSYYFDFIFFYQGGFGMITMPSRGYWWLILGVLYFSFFAILGFLLNPAEKRPPHLNVIILVTLYGIFQFFYYLGRSHPNNLFHISMPALLLTFYWLYFIRRLNPPSVPEIFKNLGFGFGAVLTACFLCALLPNAWDKIKKNVDSPSFLLDHIILAAQDLPRDDPFAQAAGQLMQKYSGDSRSLVYLFGEKGLEVSLYTGRVNAYPYNDVIQSEECPPARARILSFDPHLKPGDFIYLSRGMYQAYCVSDYQGKAPVIKATFEPEILSNLSDRFTLNLVEKKDGIAVLQITGIR